MRLNGKWFNRFVLDEKKEGAEGGGGGSGGAGGASGSADLAAKLEDQIKRNNALEERLKAIESKNSGGGDSDKKDDDLADKVRKQREADDKSKLSEKQLESALKFSLSSKEWLKDNAPLLPKSVSGIFEQADKEVYGNAIEKDSAIKASIISEFFSQQANTDLLTGSQKVALEEFNKLTKNVKQERAQQIYDTLFEPTFEMLKRIKKAEQVNKNIVNPSDAEAAYKAKLIAGSRKHYLGEK